MVLDSRLSTLIMSKCVSADDNVDTSVKTETVNISQQQSLISRLKIEKKQDEFVINNLKCHNRFLRDTIRKFQSSAQNALCTDDRMFDTMNDALESGYHLSHDGNTIYYPGESKKRKSTL